MFRLFKNPLFLILPAVLLMACGEEGTSEEKATTSSAPVIDEEMAVQLPDEVADMPAAEIMEETPESVVTEEIVAAVYLPSQVVYQEEIYKNWPYTEAPSASPAAMVESVAEAVTEKVAAAAGDTPYQIVDGKISENAMNGWRTYNGGGCGTCHGKGGIGAVGPKFG